MVNITIDNQQVSVPEGTTVLDAAKQANIKIPTLCYLHLEKSNFLNNVASCRICVVEVEGRRNLPPACATPVTEGMKITTNSKRVLSSRRKNLELILSNHPFNCLICAKSTDCELQTLAWEFGINTQRYRGERATHEIDKSSGALKRDPEKCIMCRRCEVMCNEVQTVGALTAFGRGFNTVVAPAEKKPLIESPCVYCGQCVSVCPTAALTGVGYISEVWDALFNPKKKVVVQVAPAVRVAIGEEFGMQPGQIVTGKLAAALRRIGFDGVFDTTFGADLTVIEEGREIMDRLKSGKNLPILTSCCPGWINFINYHFPTLKYMPSTCKSPQQMTGAIAKNYYAKKMGIDPKDMVVVSVMPCIAKKYEAALPYESTHGIPDVDYSITTRELAKMLKEGSVDLKNMPEETFDDPLGESTGAGVIFGATGGVLEAALRTVYEKYTGKTLEDVNFMAVRGTQGIREASIQINGRTVNVAALSGLGNARKVLEKIVKGEAHYDIIEIMACPSGCVNGGGQPYCHDRDEVIEQRIRGLYHIDRNQAIRKSHENPSIQKLYQEYLGEAGSHLAHELLHVESHN
ncbi:NADH-dependent [FeFe] hydrogenase, group A6 [Leptolinea tardivitalis]|uniref:NADH:ubiquinone oxidoreductase n=1 Tax=Leptolinea tardivitalis TaxID=229920 RepID=A0A0N8GLS7_9CHLR|nr:NADH-dependent [FeFe] hydrogenase, group A6 [Leptolinea tardivitalis]KPL73330.1 NADH:ubiquinone oxidoreductase [Leptolinea tardivitalis]GAP21464.1 NAD(P)-dependent iron-only hydrogenase catalytic subunit [Leptolinea tardivitalis]